MVMVVDQMEKGGKVSTVCSANEGNAAPVSGGSGSRQNAKTRNVLGTKEKGNNNEC